MPISEKLRRLLDENIARTERNRRTFDIKKAHQQKDYALARDLNEQMRRYNEQVEALNRQANRNPVTFFPNGDRALAPEYRERIKNGEHPYDIIEELDAGPGGIYEQPRMKAVRDSLLNDARHWGDFDVRRDMPRVRDYRKPEPEPLPYVIHPGQQFEGPENLPYVIHPGQNVSVEAEPLSSSYPEIDENASRVSRIKQDLNALGMSNEEIYRRLGF